MLRALIKFCLVIAFLFIAGLVYLGYTYKHKLETYLQDVIVAQAKSSNINLNINELKLGVGKISAESVSAFIPKAFFTFTIDTPEINLPLTSVLSLTPLLRFTGNLYQSPLSSEISYNIREKSASSSANVKDLDLAKLPQLSLFSITSGILNLDLKKLKLNQSGLNVIESSYSLSGLQTSRSFNFPLSINDQKETVTVPPISSMTINGNVSFAENKLKIENGKIISDLGNCEYYSEITSSGSNFRPETASGKIKIMLSPKGMQSFGFLLPILSNNIISSQQSKFVIDINGKTYNLKYSFTPL